MDKLFYNGAILTLDGTAAPEALLISGSRIVAVGSLADLSAQSPQAQRISLDGGALLPAFIDPHSHFSSAASALLQVPLEEAATPEEAAERIQAYIARCHIPAGQWVIGKGYDHNAYPGQKHPTAAQLDAAAPENPIIIQHQSGHAGVVNSLGLAQLHITAETPDPEGGRIGRENGALTGYLEEAAFISAIQQIPAPGGQALMGAYLQTQQDYANHGIATFQEGLMVQAMIPLYQALIDNRLLRLDLVGYPRPDAAKAFAAAFPRSVGRYDHHFKLGGIKIFLDGSPQARTAWMRRPYAGSADYRGYGAMKDAEVDAAFNLAAELGAQLLAHCNGDAAAQQFIDAAARAHARGINVRAMRPVMIHAQLLGLDQLDAVKELGIIPSFFVAHVYHWGDTHLKNFGSERAARISPAKAALDKGIPFTFHQDTPVIQPDMLETVWCAAARITKGGVTLGAEQRLPVYEALKAVTANAAYQYFEERDKGTLTPGKLADLTILDQNPRAVETDELRRIRVVQTYKEGDPLPRA